MTPLRSTRPATLSCSDGSGEGNLVACQVFRGGTELCDLQVLDVDSGQIVDTLAGQVRSSPVAWLPGGQAYYYVGPPTAGGGAGPAQLQRQVWLHRLGGSRADDVSVFAGSRGTETYRIRVSGEGRWLAVEMSNGVSRHNQLWLADLAASAPEAPALNEVRTGSEARSTISFGRGPRAERFYLRTTLHAGRARICCCCAEGPRPTILTGYGGFGISQRPS